MMLKVECQRLECRSVNVEGSMLNDELSMMKRFNYKIMLCSSGNYQAMCFHRVEAPIEICLF